MMPADFPNGRPTDNGPGLSVERELAEVFGAPVELFARNISAPTNALDEIHRIAHETKPDDLLSLAEQSWETWCGRLQECGLDDASIEDLRCRTVAEIKRETLQPCYVVIGDVDLTGLPIDYLPGSLSIDGSLRISGTLIRQIPDQTSVRGSLYLSNTPVEGIPKDLKIGRHLVLGSNSPHQQRLVVDWVTEIANSDARI